MALDLTPVYTLRERLTAAAMAGAALAREDARLHRALEELAPLEAASPVFGRIGQRARALLDPACPDPAGALLDALNLTEAVLCTQAAVAATGPVQPLPLPEGADAAPPLEAAYSELHPLLEAMRSGKYKTVSEQHFHHPEWFRDHRVLAAMVEALGSENKNLTGLVENWLIFGAGSAGLVPLLKAGFDPRGGKAMARRVRVLDAVAGAAENDFYTAQLERAEGEVRLALLFALRHAPQNAPLLLMLAYTERGNAKKMARFALGGFMDGPQVQAYWEKALDRKPEEMAYLEWSTAPWAGRLVARKLAPLLQMVTGPMRAAQQDEAAAMTPYVDALTGKSGPEICDLYRAAARTADLIRRNEAFRFRMDYVEVMGTNTVTTLFCSILPARLCASLIANPAPDLIALAEELYRGYGDTWLNCYLTAGLLSLPADAAYQRLAEVVAPGGRVDPDAARARVPALNRALQRLAWDRTRRCYLLRLGLHAPVEEYRADCGRPLPQPLDERWVPLLCQIGDERLDPGLFGLICPERPEECTLLGERFYRNALAYQGKESQVLLGYIDALRLCGWPTCKGLATRYVALLERPHWDEVRQLLRRLPGSAAAVAGEADMLYAMAIARKLRVVGAEKDDLFRLASQWHQKAAEERKTP